MTNGGRAKVFGDCWIGDLENDVELACRNKIFGVKNINAAIIKIQKNV